MEFQQLYPSVQQDLPDPSSVSRSTMPTLAGATKDVGEAAGNDVDPQAGQTEQENRDVSNVEEDGDEDEDEDATTEPSIIYRWVRADHCINEHFLLSASCQMNHCVWYTT